MWGGQLCAKLGDADLGQLRTSQTPPTAVVGLWCTGAERTTVVPRQLGVFSRQFSLFLLRIACPKQAGVVRDVWLIFRISRVTQAPVVFLFWDHDVCVCVSLCVVCPEISKFRFAAFCGCGMSRLVCMWCARAVSFFACAMRQPHARRFRQCYQYCMIRAT